MAGRTIRLLAVTARRFSTKPTTNGEIQPVIYNRNPRNLERLRLARKPVGYGLEKTKIQFWHKLEIKISSFAITAEIIHNSNKVVVSASTQEWAIRKQLHTSKGKMAFVVLAKVFAERCLESGIYNFAYFHEENETSSNVKTFLNILEEEGLMLEEPSCYDVIDIHRKNKEKRPWTVLED